MAEKIILLKTFGSRIEAELAKSFLESNGIKSIISADDAGEMYPAASIYWGVKLMVNENDFDTAISLLDDADEPGQNEEV
jgi:hypothetical protein